MTTERKKNKGKKEELQSLREKRNRNEIRQNASALHKPTGIKWTDKDADGQADATKGDQRQQMDGLRCRRKGDRLTHGQSDEQTDGETGRQESSQINKERP